MQEPNLEELKDQSIKEALATESKVKLFSCYGCKTKNPSTTGFYEVDSKIKLEQQINAFIQGREILDIQINVSRNFLPQTMAGEYEEIWYGMVRYIE